MSRAFVVSVHDLRAADVAALKVFLRFVGQSELGHWVLSEDHQDGDLRLIAWDGETWPAELDDPEGPLSVAVVEDEQASPGATCLCRPLQMEAFGDLLRRCERRKSSGLRPVATAGVAPMAAASDQFRPADNALAKVHPITALRADGDGIARGIRPASPSGPDADRDRFAAEARAGDRTPPRARRQVGARAVVTPGPQREASPATGPQPDLVALAIPTEYLSVSFRLLRWPNAAQIRSQPGLTRLLGFLGHRPMDLSQLVQYSGLAVARCQELVGFLEQSELVTRVHAGAGIPGANGAVLTVGAPAQVSASVQGVAVGVASRPSPSHDTARAPAGIRIAGLFSRLRQRLGL